MQSADGAGLSGECAFENNLENSSEAVFRHHPELAHLYRIHDRLNDGEQNLDDQFDGNIFAHHSRPLALDEKLSEEALDQSGPSALDNLEHLRRFLAHISNKWRFNFIQFELGVDQQLMQRR